MGSDMRYLVRYSTQYRYGVVDIGTSDLGPFGGGGNASLVVQPIGSVARRAT